MNVTTMGIDLAKNVFSVRGVDAQGKVVLKETVSRGRLLELFANLPPEIVGMEACSGAHHWVRQLRTLGHDARIIAPRFVIPYRKSGKNDGNDAEVICEAVIHHLKNALSLCIYYVPAEFSQILGELFMHAGDNVRACRRLRLASAGPSQNFFER